MQQSEQTTGVIGAGEHSPAWQGDWYGSEIDAEGIPYRWSKSRAKCHLTSPTPGRKRLRIYIGEFHKERLRTVHVSVNGVPAGEIRLDWLWQHYSVPFQLDATDAVTVELSVAPLDAKYIGLNDDRSDFGIAVREVEILDDPGPLEHVDLPRWLILETTSKCNLRCQMCAITEGLVPPGHMAWETFERLRPLFPGLKRADLYGHGETFLHKRFFDMLTELRQHDANVRVITNATLVKQDVAERLVSLGLDKFIVSFDGASKELYEEIRVGARYDAVLQNIRGLMKEREIRGSVRPHLQFQYMGMKKSIHEFPDFIRLAADLGAERVSLVSLHEYPGVVGQALRHNQAHARPFALEARAIANEKGLVLDLPMHELGGDAAFEAEMASLVAQSPPLRERYADGSINSDFLFTRPIPELDAKIREAKQRTGAPMRHCYDPWNFVYVKQDGAVGPCCVTSQVMGNVNHTPVVDIWQGFRYGMFRDWYLGYRTPECQTCPHRAIA